jgi:acetoin utilization deacetylase AcuC-like enzyme
MHPERPERLRAVYRALEDEAFAGLDRREAPKATLAQIGLVHTPGYAEAILDAIPESGTHNLDGDTIISPGSGEAALRAAGGACAAVDAVITGEARNVFVATRPPGHHAEPATPMGFCLFSNVAIAARHAQAAHGLAKVAVMDFDVHHGNGTQAAFWDVPSLLYTSTHQMPLYPGTGAVGETGIANNIVNAPLAPRSDGVAFREAMEARILPAIDAFAPDLLIISAGFDAHHRDPLASLDFEAEDFAWATLELMAMAERHCGGRLISCLEGGYDLQGLAESTAAHVKALMG